jgi:hypothetical protein
MQLTGRLSKNLDFLSSGLHFMIQLKRLNLHGIFSVTYMDSPGES